MEHRKPGEQGVCWSVEDLVDYGKTMGPEDRGSSGVWRTLLIRGLALHVGPGLEENKQVTCRECGKQVK